MQQLQQLNVPHIVSYIDSCIRDREGPSKPAEALLLMEFCENGNLLEHLQKRKGEHYSEKDLLKKFAKLCTYVLARVMYLQGLKV